MIEIRCKKCNSKICEVIASSGTITFPCKKCGTWNYVDIEKLVKALDKVMSSVVA